jgi:hypothetical protein
MKLKNETTNQMDPQETLRIQMAKLKLRYPHLSDSDLHFDYGKKEVMMIGLQAKLGKTREELELLLKELLTA